MMAFLLFFSLPTLAATEDVFSRFQDRLVQIRILEASTGVQAGVGSGFFASSGGLIVTNYHVISDLIQSPNHYRGEVVTTSGQRAPAKTTLLNPREPSGCGFAITSTPGWRMGMRRNEMPACRGLSGLVRTRMKM